MQEVKPGLSRASDATELQWRKKDLSAWFPAAGIWVLFLFPLGLLELEEH